MRLKFIVYRYEIFLTIIALFIIGSMLNISNIICVESPAQNIQDSALPVAITFDDGPYPSFTEKLLIILNKYDVKATFFVIGRHASEYPYLIRLIDSNGHEIGGHTYNHANITKLSPEKLQREMEDTKQAIEKVTGKPAFLFRPPGGRQNKKTLKFISSLGYTTVLWSVLPKDVEANIRKEDIIRIVKEETKPNSIILLHCGRQETLDALPEIICYLKSRGYKFVTISELLSGNAKSLRRYII